MDNDFSARIKQARRHRDYHQQRATRLELEARRAPDGARQLLEQEAHHHHRLVMAAQMLLDFLIPARAAVFRDDIDRERRTNRTGRGKGVPPSGSGSGPSG